MRACPVCPASVRQWLLIALFSVLQPQLTFCQVIYNNTFTGTGACPTQGNTPTVSANATGTPFTRSTVTCRSSADVFNSETLNNTASVNNSSYIEFSVTANANAQLNVTSLSFKRDASPSAPNQLEVRYSTDGFATSTGWGAAPNTPTTGASITWNFADFSVPPGKTLTFRFYPYGTQRADLGGAASGTTGTFSVDDVTLNGAAPLPVNLVSFTGKFFKNEVTLNWVTTWEEENQGFEILKSTDAKSFESVGAVVGKYNAQGQSVYEFTDQHVTPGQTYYYRLKQNDIGGASALSQLIAVLTDPAGLADQALIFPNPNNGSFTLLQPALPSANVKLYSPSGAEIPINTEENNAQKSLAIRARTDLKPGVYYLHVNPEDGTKTKIIKVLVH